MLKKWRRSLNRAALFEVIHVPVDVSVAYLLTGNMTLSIIAILIQHGVVLILHTCFDRYSYRNYEEIKNDSK